MVGFLQELLCGEFLTFAPAIYFVRCSQVAMQEPLPVTAGAAQVHCRVTSNLEQTVVGQRQGMSDTIHKAAEANWAVIESQHLVFCEVMFKEADWGDGFPSQGLLGMANTLEWQVQFQSSEQVLIDIEVQVFQTHLKSVFVLTVLLDDILDISDQFFLRHIACDRPPFDFRHARIVQNQWIHCQRLDQ